jgi:hypothetical protein
VRKLLVGFSSLALGLLTQGCGPHGDASDNSRSVAAQVPAEYAKTVCVSTSRACWTTGLDVAAARKQLEPLLGGHFQCETNELSGQSILVCKLSREYKGTAYQFLLRPNTTVSGHSLTLQGAKLDLIAL